MPTLWAKFVTWLWSRPRKPLINIQMGGLSGCSSPKHGAGAMGDATHGHIFRPKIGLQAPMEFHLNRGANEYNSQRFVGLRGFSRGGRGYFKAQRPIMCLTIWPLLGLWDILYKYPNLKQKKERGSRPQKRGSTPALCPALCSLARLSVVKTPHSWGYGEQGLAPMTPSQDLLRGLYIENVSTRMSAQGVTPNRL